MTKKSFKIELGSSQDEKLEKAGPILRNEKHAILMKLHCGYHLMICNETPDSFRLTASEPYGNDQGLFTLIKIALDNGAETFEIMQ